LLKGSQITPNMIDRARILAKKYFDDKGYKNAEISINQRDDVANKNQVILDVVVDKKQKMKVHSINIVGNEALSDSKIKGKLFTKGAFAKTHEAGKLSTFLKAKKFTPERWKEDKQKLIDKYNEYGYRDAYIVEDSVWNYDEKHVNIYIKVDEGQKYYLRDIKWVGNTIYPTSQLSNMLGMKKGDVYNQKMMNKRLSEDDDAVGNLYWNNGYLFYNLQPTEVNIVGDSIDLEMRIQEGPQAHISHVRTRKGTELSGGERRRVEIARCLALEPQFILLDEPFAGVDPLAVADIQEIIQYLRQRGMGILITDHNVRETLQIVDRAYILSEGKILLEGDSQTIAQSPVAKKFYLGENFTL